MSLEHLLATAVAHAPNFDPASALGRIHSILSALIQHCSTRAAYQFMGCFTCELQILPQGNAFIPAVVPNFETKAELLRTWELLREIDIPDEDLVPQSLYPIVSEPHHLHLTKTAESFISPDAFQRPESIAPLLSRVVIAPFALCCALNICYNAFWKVLPIATLIFQIVFFLHFVVFALIFSAAFCTIILASC